MKSSDNRFDFITKKNALSSFDERKLKALEKFLKVLHNRLCRRELYLKQLQIYSLYKIIVALYPVPTFH